MKPRYHYINSPIKIRNTILKSRLIYPTAQPHYLQGPESYPADPVVSFYCQMAKNGAAMVLMHDLANDYQRSIAAYDIPHFAMYDLKDKGAQNYFTHFAYMLHYYGSKVCISLQPELPAHYSVNEGGDHVNYHGGYMKNSDDDLEFSFGALVGPEGKCPGMTEINRASHDNVFLSQDKIDEYIDVVLNRIRIYQSFKFDAAVIPIDLMLKFFCAATNHRTDEYGGSRENRARFPVYMMERLRNALGNDFIFYINAPYEGDNMGVKMSMEEVVGFLKLLEPYADVLYLRSASGDLELDDSYAPGIEMGKTLKAAGIQTPIAISTPYMNLEMLENVIASGAADFIQTSHMFLCNPELGDIIQEGRGEDLIPCILCHNCRGVAFTNDFMSHCTLNPRMGMEYRADKMIAPVTKRKRVAIIGGGPGGMNAALYLKQRGHEPILFEQSDALGGELKRVANCDFKWRLNRYREFLVHQMARKQIEVRLNMQATPETIEQENFDVVIVAIGGSPVMPDLPGIEYASMNVYSAFQNEEKLGRNVVVIGGSAVPAEAAIYLARAGHNVTEISRKNIVAYELNPIRERGNVNRFSCQCGVHHIRSARTIRLEKGRVFYQVADGPICAVACDDIVVCGGLAPKWDEAMAFFGSAPEFYAIGDCKENGSMRTAIFDAYGLCMNI